MAPGGVNRFTITTPGGSISKLFNVTSVNTLGLKPVITQLMPKGAKPGAQITIFGHHFSGASFVKIGGLNATFRIPSDSRIVVKVPMKAHSGNWTVKTALRHRGERHSLHGHGRCRPRSKPIITRRTSRQMRRVITARRACGNRARALAWRGREGSH